MMAYMGLTGMKRALYLARNKDTDELYSERIRYDSTAFRTIMDRAERIIRATRPPERITDRPDDWRCRFCDAHAICWGGETALPLSCRDFRQSVSATPEIDEGETWARWSCAKRGRNISPDEFRAEDPNHLVIPDLITFADPTDAGEDWIEFTNHSDGAVWRHGNGEGMWSTDELMITPVGQVGGKKAVQVIKEAFGGTIEHIERMSLIDHYPPSDSEKLWDGPDHELAGAAGVLGFDCWADQKPTAHEETDETNAAEYAGKYLVVTYKKHNHAAIWKGKE